MARTLVIGNWKLNGALATNQALIEGLARAWNPSVTVTWVVCPPFPYLAQVGDLLRGTGIHWGGQDVSNERSGAFTGEVSAGMLVEFGCRYAIVGHSERRARWAETSERVAEKAVAALEAGLTPVICIGESLGEREAGRTLEVLSAQLKPILSSIKAHRLPEIVLAYEPVWAIGTGRHATVEQVAEVHGFIRSSLAAVDLAAAGEVSILYGGSVKPGNASEYKALDNVDGVLVGGASLVAHDFVEIARAFQGSSDRM